MGAVVSSCNQKKLSGKRLSRGYPIPEQLISETKVCFMHFNIVPFHIFIISFAYNFFFLLHTFQEDDKIEEAKYRAI